MLDNGAAVLNASDPLVADFALLCDGEIIFFGRDPDATPLAGHLSNGGRAVLLREHRIMLTVGTESTALTDLNSIPMTANGAPNFQTENVLAAVAAAWALGISHDLIRAVIETFDPIRDEALDKAALVIAGI